MNVYFKATAANATSRDGYKYKLGLNVEANADKGSGSPCGKGLHLAKTIRAAIKYVPDYKEIYLARPGVILGEDDDKVRCSYIWLDRQLTVDEIRKYIKLTIADQYVDKFIHDLKAEYKLTTEPVCGWEWVKNKYKSFTIDDFNKQSLCTSGHNHTLTIKASATKKDIKIALGAVR